MGPRSRGEKAHAVLATHLAVLGVLAATAAGDQPSTADRSFIQCQRNRTAGVDYSWPALDTNDTMHDFAATFARPWNGTDEPASKRTYVFLLGYPFSGTSAAHFLLGTSPAVSTLADPGLIGPNKEGWAIQGLKNTNQNLWKEDDDFIPWHDLYESYLEHWDLDKPILLENSPHEIIHTPKLYETFKRDDNDVRFVALIRSPCNQHLASADEHAKKMMVIRDIVRRFGRRRVFVMRYEDMCFEPLRVADALDTWLPGLGSWDVARLPNDERRRLVVKHKAKIVPLYCYANFITQLPYFQEMPTRQAELMRDLLKFFDYSQSVMTLE